MKRRHASLSDGGAGRSRRAAYNVDRANSRDGLFEDPAAKGDATEEDSADESGEGSDADSDGSSDGSGSPDGSGSGGDSASEGDGSAAEEGSAAGEESASEWSAEESADEVAEASCGDTVCCQGRGCKRLLEVGWYGGDGWSMLPTPTRCLDVEGVPVYICGDCTGLEGVEAKLRSERDIRRLEAMFPHHCGRQLFHLYFLGGCACRGAEADAPSCCTGRSKPRHDVPGGFGRRLGELETHAVLSRYV